MQIYKKNKNQKKFIKSIAILKKKCIFAASKQAEVAQLVEHNLAKVGVASPSLVFRSTVETLRATSLFFVPTLRSLRSLVRQSPPRATVYY